MPTVYEGQLTAKDKRFGIVVGRFNEFITSKLLEGALDCLTRHGTPDDLIDVYWAPGSFEIPQVADKIASGKKYDAIVCLGAVIRGSTPHFDYIAAEVSKGVAHAALKHSIPVAFGVLTTDTVEQAIERAGTKAGNKGWEAALSAIEMADLMKQIEE